MDIIIDLDAVAIVAALAGTAGGHVALPFGQVFDLPAKASVFEEVANAGRGRLRENGSARGDNDNYLETTTPKGAAVSSGPRVPRRSTTPSRRT